MNLKRLQAFLLCGMELPIAAIFVGLSTDSMEFTSVDLIEESQVHISVAAHHDPDPIAANNSTSTEGVHQIGLSTSGDTSEDLSIPQSVSTNTEVRQPRTLSVNNKPNPLANRRGGSVKSSLSPKTSVADMTAESSPYPPKLEQPLESEIFEQVSELPITSEFEDKPRPPRAISMSGNAVNPLAKRRGSSIRPTFTQVQLQQPEAEVEETVVMPILSFFAPPMQAPPPIPSSPPPLPPPEEEDMARPSVSLSFGGLYAVRPSMIETEYVADMRPESPMQRMSAIQESEDDHHEGRSTYDELNDSVEDMYAIRISTIDVERPKPPPVPQSPPPVSAPPPIPLSPPVEEDSEEEETEFIQPIHAPPPPPPAAAPTTEADVSPAHPLADTEYNKVRMSYASDDEESPAHPAHYAKQHTAQKSSAYAAPPTVMTSALLYKDITPKPSDVYLAGVGWKLCPSITIVWQERYFVLKTDGSIHYYTDKASFMGGFAPRGVIVINDIQRGVKGGIHIELLQNKLNIGVHSKNSRVYKLKFGTAEEAAKWKDAIFRFVK